jgi:ubiquinone/menaquinone biosynthesis C-methylase UbiE
MLIKSSMDYSPIAGNYDRMESDAKTLWLLGYATVVQLISPLDNKKILDYGCGTGVFCRLLREKGSDVTGVDLSKGMIDVAKKNSPDGIDYCRVKSGDLGRFRERSFDHAVSNFVFCEVPAKTMIRKIVKEVFRVLKDNGLFVLMNSNWEKSNGREFVSFRLEYCDNLVSGCRIRAITKSEPPIIFEDYFRSKEEYCSLLEEAGLTIESTGEPLAAGNEPFWLDEREYPPFFIIAGRKKL